ncbi:MAG TPA: crosslink repair DNA glycosylase YcaQ family protein, partial [Jiangellaceae bacterium]|nr:crosslink repair DNA glycosylase YcaQ family protein [Jiangellaceae bacterium]
DLRPQLDVLHDERGRVLVDLPDAPRPDQTTPAPVRFLPEYDNVLLSHADRSRFFSVDVSRLYPPGRLGRGHVLVDGTVQATWIVDGDAITVRHLDVSDEALGEVSAVAERLASFLGVGESAPRFEATGRRSQDRR